MRYLAFILAFLSLYSCKTNSESTLLVEWKATKALQVGENEFEFSLKDVKSGQYITGAKVMVEANMNHAGMVPIFAEAVITEDQKYKVNYTSTMVGTWILFLDITDQEGKKHATQFSFEISK